MESVEWREVITKAMVDVGSYRDSYSIAIDALADILERRDLAKAQWEKEKKKIIVNKKSDRGAVNKSKNPLLGILRECETDILSYCKDLGLTPAGMKKATSDDDEKKVSPLDSLAQIMGMNA